MQPLLLEYENEERDMRIDAYLSSCYIERSRTYFQKLIKEGLVRVLSGDTETDGIDSRILFENAKTVKPGYFLNDGEQVLISFPEDVGLSVEAENIPLDIVYEDEDVILVNKPKGMVIHPACGHQSGTLVNALLYHCKDLSGINGVLRPGIVHRIDRDTTGILICCKNDESHKAISEQLSVHSLTRGYKAIVVGNIRDDEGTIDAPIGRDKKDRKKMAVTENGKRAVTHYRVLERYQGYTLCEFHLETGRTHQIRVHMAYIGHPLLGDTVYGA